MGLARSGIAVANLLAESGVDVVVSDLKKESELRECIRDLNGNVRLELGRHPDEIFSDADMVILSPGVPADIPGARLARQKGIPVIGELEFAYQLATFGDSHAAIPPLVEKGGFLAVTGTNGKSTTTALLDWTMRKAGYRTILGGNIGNALTGEIRSWLNSRHPVDFVVVEVSSFQLETISRFRPLGAVITNITPDHLDRYHNMGAYVDAKAKIFENQRSSDFLVLNHDDPVSMELYRERLSERRRDVPQVFFFSRHNTVSGVYARDGIVFSTVNERGSLHRPFELIRTEDIRIQGVHNLENAMAATAMALLAGCSIEAVRDALRTFQGLEHRLEFVRELNGVRYFNDSKGTNVGAVLKSLESFTSPIILIAGGRDKAGDFSLLRGLVRERVKALVLIGESGETIRKALGDCTDTMIARDLKHAVEVSRMRAEPGDVVLLSPACASFDMFANFEDRGRQFKKIVWEMEEYAAIR